MLSIEGNLCISKWIRINNKSRLFRLLAYYANSLL